MRTVFIIDDDPGYLKLMAGKLNLLGYTTEVFESVLDALPRFKAKPDVIFLDHHYANSVCKGHEFIELIRLHTSDSSIIYFSADRKEELSTNYSGHKADAFLRKDEHLLDIIAGFLDKLFEQREKKSSFIKRIFLWLLQIKTIKRSA